ncbi:MAG: DUF4178 domain-containing protein [Bacteriovorax sp.]|jgi:hypothetical protein
MAGNSAPYVKTFNCPSCGGQVSIRASGFSINVVCQSCHAVIDSTNENYKIIARVQSKKKPTIDIPLGSRGKLFGTFWEIVGFILKEDLSEYRWKEYLLFNPRQGYRWLSEYEGHWNFIKMTKQKPELSGDTATLNGKTYEKFASNTAVTKFVAGEFYWQIRLEDRCKMEEFISPPHILSMEYDDEEIVWSVGEKISSQVVKTAFKLEGIPKESGIAPNQVNPYKSNADAMKKLAYLFIVLAFVIQIFSIAQKKNLVVLDQEFTLPLLPQEKITRSDSFNLSGHPDNLEIKMFTKVLNSWIEVQGEVINENKNDEAINFSNLVEYYYGSDMDGSWAEGSQVNETTLPSIPQGTYHINFDSVSTEPTINPINNDSRKFSLVVTRSVPSWSNFWWTVLILMIFPAFYVWRSSRFENARWEQSSIN